MQELLSLYHNFICILIYLCVSVICFRISWIIRMDQDGKSKKVVFTISYLHTLVFLSRPGQRKRISKFNCLFLKFLFKFPKVQTLPSLLWMIPRHYRYILWQLDILFIYSFIYSQTQIFQNYEIKPVN
jgi:hypothetical protein